MFSWNVCPKPSDCSKNNRWEPKDASMKVKAKDGCMFSAMLDADIP